ncbi:UNVERIFIED_CONTAM: glycosyltransferase [Aeromonas salmonicida]
MSHPILVVGAFDYPYINNHWLEPLSIISNENLISFDVNVLLSILSTEDVEKYLKKIIKEFEVRYVFFYHDLIFADLSDCFFSEIKETTKVITFYADDEPPVWFQRNVRFDHHYSHIATHSVSAIEKRKEQFPERECYYLPWGFNPRIIKYDMSEDKHQYNYDVIFIGRNKDSLGSGLYREDGAIRDQLLQAIANTAKHHGWRFAIFGFGWENHPTLAPWYARQISDDEYQKILASSRIVFNPGYACDGKSLKPQVKLRHFEVAANGYAMQLTNNNTELGTLFEENKEIVFYDTAADLVEKIKYWLDKPQECANCAHLAKISAFRRHTIDSRLCDLMSSCDVSIPVADFINIDKVAFNGNIRVLKGLIESSTGEYVYIFPKGTDVHIPYVPASYAIIERPEIVDCELFSYGYSKLRDPVQPRREEIYACHVSKGEFVGNVTPGLMRIIGGELSQSLKMPLHTSLIHRETLLECICDTDSIHALNIKLASLGHRSSLNTMLIMRFDSWLCGEFGVNTVNPLYWLLDRVSERCIYEKKKLIVYGVRGDLAESAISYLKTSKGIDSLVLVDNALKGSSLPIGDIYGHDDISSTKDMIVLICAAISGPAIMAQCVSLDKSVKLLPLYDPFFPAWGSFK